MAPAVVINQHATKNVEGPLDHSTFKPVTQTQAAELVGVPWWRRWFR